MSGPVASGGLGSPGSIGGWGIEGGGSCRGKTVGAKAGEEGRDIARVRHGERSS
jgi:hypothetical protein